MPGAAHKLSYIGRKKYKRAARGGNANPTLSGFKGLEVAEMHKFISY